MVTIKLGDLTFPINPSELFFNRSGSVNEINVISFGAVTKPYYPKPVRCSFSGIFSINKYLFINGDGKTPLDCINYLESVFLNLQPVGFSISGNIVPKSFNAIIERFGYGEKAECDGDVYFNIDICEYKEISPFIINRSDYYKKPPIVASSNTQNNSTNYRQHIVKKGDTLWDLSIKYLGRGDRYLEISTINNIKNPRLIHVGQVLTIPW